MSAEQSRKITGPPPPKRSGSGRGRCASQPCTCSSHKATRAGGGGGARRALTDGATNYCRRLLALAAPPPPPPVGAAAWEVVIAGQQTPRSWTHSRASLLETGAGRPALTSKGNEIRKNRFTFRVDSCKRTDCASVAEAASQTPGVTAQVSRVRMSSSSQASVETRGAPVEVRRRESSGSVPDALI